MTQVSGATSVRIPFFDKRVELSVKDKKVLAVAIVSLVFFGIQLQASLMATFVATFIFTSLTYLCETYIQKDPDQKIDWFNTNFGKREMIFLCTLLLLRPLIFQILCWALKTAMPKMAQEGLAKLILTQPWRMIPTTVIIAPVVEEVLFRGFLLERVEDCAHFFDRSICRLSSTVKYRISNCFQAVIFGALHINKGIRKQARLPLFAVLSLTGYIFGSMKRKSRSLFAPMAVHSAHNAGAVIGIFTTAG